jgi:hypothetical protein
MAEGLRVFGYLPEFRATHSRKRLTWRSAYKHIYSKRRLSEPQRLSELRWRRGGDVPCYRVTRVLRVKILAMRFGRMGVEFHRRYDFITRASKAERQSAASGEQIKNPRCLCAGAESLEFLAYEPLVHLSAP